MERLKRMFPTLAQWPAVKLMMAPVGIAWAVLVVAALVHVLLWPHDMPILN